MNLVFHSATAYPVRENMVSKKMEAFGRLAICYKSRFDSGKRTKRK